ncbi:MAG: hypothetical protein NVSMB12_20570 [Acidimicrobiales bacterium]
MTTTVALLLLFVVLPFVVAGGVIAFISWRSGDDNAPIRTSDVLREGEPASAEVLTVRNLGTILDVRPMIRVHIRISPAVGAAFELDVTQAVARSEVRRIRVGEQVDVRVLADRSAAALIAG